MSVTKLACEGCGADLMQLATGRPRRTCSSPCRQKVYRRRQAERVNSVGQLRPVRLAPEPPLTPGEFRRLLRAAIDRRARERIAARDRAAGVALLEEWRRAA